MLGAISCKGSGIPEQKENLLLHHKNEILPKYPFDGSAYTFPIYPSTMADPFDAGRPCEDESYVLALSEVERSSVITFSEHFFPLLSYTPGKRKRYLRSENSLSISAQLFSDIYDSADLPVKDKTHLLGVLNTEYLQFEQKSGIDVDDYSNVLMCISRDLI